MKYWWGCTLVNGPSIESCICEWWPYHIEALLTIQNWWGLIWRILQFTKLSNLIPCHILILYGMFIYILTFSACLKAVHICAFCFVPLVPVALPA